MIRTFKRWVQSWFGDPNEEVVLEPNIEEEHRNKRPLPELSDEVDHSLEDRKRRKLAYGRVNGTIESPYMDPNTSNSCPNEHKFNGVVDTVWPENCYIPHKSVIEKPNLNNHTPVSKTVRPKCFSKENLFSPRKNYWQSSPSSPELSFNKVSALSDLNKIREKIAYEALIKSQTSFQGESNNYNLRPLLKPFVKHLVNENDKENVSKIRNCVDKSTEYRNAEPSFNVATIDLTMRKPVKSPPTRHTEWIHDLNKRFNQLELQRKLKIKEEELKSRIFQDNNKIFDKILQQRLLDQIKVREVIELEEAQTEIEDSEVETILPVLTKAEEEKILNAMLAPKEQRFSEKFHLTITGECLNTLYGLTWLNDNVINFYMSLIMQRSEETKKFKVFTFNTFFCDTLRKRGYSAIRRWTKKVDIFSCDLVPIPIHVNKIHWCMLIIDFRKKSINFYDSMGSVNDKVLDMIEEYLKAEHLDKKKTELDFSGWSKVCVEDIPQQMNGCDCGVFSCMFAEYITRGAKLNFSQRQMPYFRKKMCLEILLGKLLT